MAFKPLDDAPAGSVSFRPLDDTEATTPTAADYLKGAASGVGGLVSGIGYLAEAAGANQLGGSIRGIGDTTQRYWQDSMTPAGQRAAQSQVFDDDPGSALPKLGDRWGQALAMGAAQSAPSMLAAAIPGGIAAAGLRGVAGMAASRGIGGALAPLAAGTAAPIGGWATNLAGNLAARVPTALGFGAAEGAVAGASNAAQWKSDIEQKPLAELRNMPGFAALEAQIGEQAARQQIAEQGAADIMARTALATGGIGALTGGGALGSAFQRVTTGAKGGILGAIGRDAAKEAGQEIPQSGGERAIQNIATRDYIDPSQSITQGVLADALSGGAIGGVMGGVTGGGSHLAKGPLQKAAEASAATTPPTTPLPDTQTAGIPAGTNGIPAGTIPGINPPEAGIAAAAQNTPAAPGITPASVSTAAPSLPTNQAESAGVPVSQPQEGAAARGNETEVAKPAEPGQQAQPAAVSGAAGAVGNTGTQPAKDADSAAAEREWQDFVTSEGRDIGPRQLAVVRAQFMRRRLMNAGIEAATGRVEDARQREVAANRMAILEALPLTTAGNTIRRFAAALRDAGIRDFRVSPEERQLIARRIAARDTLQPLEQAPPNELALPEKQAKQAQPTMPRIESLRRRAAMPGVRIVGNRMLDRHGKRLATLSDSEVSELLPKPKQAPARTVEDTELADFIKSESADLGKRRVTLRALQALRQQKQAEADKTDLEDLIEAERADLRERFARMQDAQAAARAKKPFVVPALMTPAQPTTTRALEQKAVQMPVPKIGARQNAAYSLPDKSPHDDWRGYERKDFVPTARQTIVMEAAKEAIDNGLFYEKDVDEFVAKKLNVSPAMLASNRSGVDGGDFGYDVYFARRTVEAIRKRSANADAAKLFKVGQKLGALKLQPPKLASAVVVEDVDDGTVQVSFTYGSKRMSGMIDAAALKTIVDRQRQADDARKTASTTKAQKEIEQKAADVPLGKYGKSELVGSADKLPAAAKTEPTSNAGELPAAEASTANTQASEPLENPEELPPDADVAADDIGAIFDKTMDDVFGEAPARTPKSEQPKQPSAASKARAEREQYGRPRGPRSAPPSPAPKRDPAASAASAAKNAGMGLADVAKGLNALFKPKPGTLGMGLPFDEDTYAAAKPYFIAGVAHFKQAGADIAEMMKSLIMALRDQFGMDRQTITAMKPYVVRFMEDAKAGKLDYDEASTPKEAPDDSTDQGGSPPLDQPMAEGQRPDTPIRGAVTPRSRPRRSDDRGVRGAGRRADGSADESKPLGNGGRSAAVSDGTNGVVAGGVRRVSADFRPGLGALTREGSWFDAAKRNIDLIELAIQIDKEKRNATTEEQAQLAKYVGFGASEIRNALFPIPGEYAKRLEPNRLVWPDLVRDARWKPLAERIDALPREWQKSILQSTQYAHYTSEGIIRSIWSAIQRLGFTGGNIFEPGTGIGSFSMLMPDGIHETSLFTGVEFDAPTALIARLLSPDQQIQHDDFIKRKFPKNYFDVNVGNPPFSQTKILGDAEYAKHGFMLHDFFFAKGIDLVRPGGLQVFVTSKGTMDKKNDRARKFLSDRADLIGAIRLPSTAFEGNAGTSVVTDVIFLKKRAPGEAPGGMAWGAIKTVDTKDGPVEVNEYFADHPEMILGQQRISGNIDDLGRRVSSNGYGGEKYTVVSYDSTPAELDAKFAEAVERLPQNVYSPLSQSDEAVKKETRKVDFDPSVTREGVIYLNKDGAILRVASGVGVPLDESVKLSDKDRAWLKGYVGIRDLVQAARLAQVTDGDWKAALRALNKAYDAFRAERGPILDFRTQIRKSTDEDGNIVEAESRIFKNKRLYREDYDSALLTSLESISESGEIVKSPFLLGRTIGKPVVVEVKGIGDALAVSLDSIGSLDLADIGRRMGLSREDTIEALGNQIYKTPSGQWQLADEYLSGDVVTKLEEAEHLARTNPEYRRNVEALKEVQPEKLGPSQISAKLGASWVPVEHVNEFAKEIGAGYVTFDIKTETWQVDGGNRRTERRAGAEYGTTARSASELLEAALNSRSIKVTAVVDKKTVTDVAATTAANEMAKKIKDKFKRWVWTDSDRASELVEAYNKRFNNIAPRKFDGSHLTLPGVSLRFKLHPHQLRSIWRQIQTGDTYLAHAVGAGKTIEMIAGAMEQKRLGLIKKPMFVVPNHMLEQFSNEFMELYPLANIMVADDENFSAERRKAFVASATLNSPDAIIITHSAFKRIGVTEASVAPIRDEIVTDLELELSSLAKDQGTRVRRSQLEQQIEAVNQRFDAIIGASGKDSTIKFEDIGADFIYADEAHAFRKLDFHTAQQIKGIDPNGSQAAMDMYVKTRILERARPGRAFVFASGTPVTNTMGELFTIMRFFAPQEMELAGISTFDSWARQFGEVAPALEPNAAGKYELIERFAKFDNVPELMSRVRQFMDVLTSESLGALVKRPDLAGGKPNLVVVEPTKALKEYMKGELSRRIEASKAWKPSPGQMSNPDPIVSIITDGRFAAIDPRFFGAELEGESIITKMASNVVAKYHATKGNVYHDKEGNPAPIKGSTQIVFYNLGFGEQSQRSRGFNSRAAFTKLLTDGGIPRDEIAWFDDANTDAKKEAIFKDMRSGKLKVLIGSAKKMGTGVNVQNRLIALHYQDPPWFPADVEQPHGRIIRQGNLNPEVSIDWYTTKGTYQSTMWQMVGRKQRFIDQAFTGDKSLRSMDDMGEASLFEQAAAVASGDPRALQLAGLRQDVERFERLQAAHASEQINIRNALRNAEWNVEYATKRIAQLSMAFKAIGERYFQFDSGVVDGRTYNKPGEFGQALKDAFNRATRARLMDMAGGDSIQIASIGSAIKITMEAQIDNNKPTGAFSMYVEFGGSQFHVVTAASLGEETDATGLARKTFNQINNVDSDLRRRRGDLATYEADIIRLNKKLGAPFEYQQEMAEKYGELKRLEAELQGEGEKVVAPSSSGKKQERDNPIQQAALSGALPGERQLARYDYQDVMARESGALPGESRFNQASNQAASPADRAIFSMAAEGKPADEILSFISKASRRPFNRVLAAALRRAGLVSSITLDTASRFGKQQGAARYAAAYNERTDTVALFTYRDAERHVLHELVHAATMKAIAGKGPAAVRMRALFRHVQKSGSLDGQYGMKDVDEFVAEAFSNPRFQEALRSVPAPAGSTLKSAWQWFVRIVARIVGIRTQPSETALDRALTVGAQLMNENAALAGRRGDGDTRYAIAWHGTPHVWPPEPGFPHGRPRLDKMGTGEGAQAYGWGWYSAEAQDVAKRYQTTLTADRGFDFGGKSGLTREQVQDLVNAREGNKYLDGVSLPSGVADRVIDDIVYGSNGRPLPRQYKPGSERAALYQKLVNEIRHTDDGSLYQLDIPDDVMPKLLDWDKPLREQSAAVREALTSNGLIQEWPVANDSGASFYRRLAEGGTLPSGWAMAAQGRAKETSMALASLGIPGLRYLDGSSRSKGEGTYNYVIWDQKVLDRIALLERNGEALDAIRAADEMRFSLDAGQPFDGPEVATTPLKPGTTAINVDGIERPAMNSNSKPIHWSEEGVRNFWRWFGESKVVDEQGRPLVVYHGTNNDFSAFHSADDAYYFAAAPDGQAAAYSARTGGNIMPVFLRVNNPASVDAFLDAGAARQERGAVSRLRAEGYDGVLYPKPHTDDDAVWITFRPEQIKSAIGNAGTFDGTDPDIRYNIAADWHQSPVAQQVAKAFKYAAKSDAKLSWLNPVQTQYHKAETLAKQGKFGFKRVFELGQKFLSDISRFAVMAENSAPTLFHQIRSIADAKQAAGAALRGDFGKQRNADIRAIAAPLYEGTLYGGGNPMAGMVWSDAQLRSRFGLTDSQIRLYHEAREAVKVSMDEMAKSLIARHAKREKVAADTSGSLQEVAESVRDTLTLRADVLADEAQAEHDDTMQQVQDLREAGRQDKRAADMQKEADAKLESQKAEVARIRATVADVQAIADKAQKLQDAGYFPLMRFGRHTVTARDADGKVRHFSMHDGIPLVPRSGQAQANKLADALREEHPDWDVTTGLMNPEKYKLYQGMNVDALQLFADHLDDETKQTYQEIIRLATNERSVLRRMLKREGTPGFDRDVRRTLASFILSNARYTSSSYHLADMAKAAEQAEEDGGDVGAEAVKLYDYVTKPQEEAAKLRGFLFFNFMGGSIAAAMVNATQVPMMTFPRLAQYEDAGKLAARLARAAKMATGNPQDVAGEVGAALRMAEENGITAPHQIYEMTATAANNIFAGSMGGSALLRAWGAPFAIAESFNRRTTFIAAWQIGQGMTANQLRDAGAANAFEFAEKMVQETQGIYNRGNRMNVGRGAIGATVMTFKQFSVMYLEMFSRLPPRQKAIMAGMLILAAGAGGLPFAEDIEDIIDTIGQWLGYRTNTRRTIRRGLSAVAGQRAADIAMNGVLSQLGVDLHSRLGLHNILPGSALLKPSTTDKGREFQDLLGPAASVVAAMGQALQDLATGRPDKAALAMAPVAIQNAAKGIAMANTGRATDMRGKPTIPVNWVEAGAKGIGFNPKSVADYGTIKRDSTQDDRLIDVTRERFTAAIVDAILADDQDARREALQDVADWNKRNPDARIAINPAAIRRRVADMRAEGPARVLKSLSPSLRQQARQEFADAQ